MARQRSVRLRRGRHAGRRGAADAALLARYAAGCRTCSRSRRAAPAFRDGRRQDAAPPAPGSRQPGARTTHQETGETLSHARPAESPAVRRRPRAFRRAQARGRRLAIATDCARDELRHYLDMLEIDDLLDTIACGDDVDHGKPEPDLPLLAMQRLHTPSGVMTGDTPFDAQAAGKAGLAAVGVLTGGFNDADLRHAGCAAVHADVAALRAAL
ncbi:MAG: HAD family hydrolase [Alphaproteobacteria bacterium]|nr:HAD family hydrolase [Alphaproteobacteria bacterium]